MVPPERLLVLNLEGKGFGWDEICEFLGLEVPEAPYPRVFPLEEFQDAADRRLKSQYRKIWTAFLGVAVVGIAATAFKFVGGY